VTFPKTCPERRTISYARIYRIGYATAIRYGTRTILYVKRTPETNYWHILLGKNVIQITVRPLVLGTYLLSENKNLKLYGDMEKKNNAPVFAEYERVS